MSTRKFSIRSKILALLLVFIFTFQSLNSINGNTYTTGFSNFHSYCPEGITCCFGPMFYHMTYNCGKPFHFTN